MENRYRSIFASTRSCLKSCMAVIGDSMKEEDQVVHLLACLPESFNVLVTALESNTDVPKTEVVTERVRYIRKDNSKQRKQFS